MNLFLTVAILFCQRTYYVSQGGPKCRPDFGNNIRRIRISDIKEYETFDYIECKGSYPEGNNNIFIKCEKDKPLHTGCKFTMSDGTTHESEFRCENL